MSGESAEHIAQLQWAATVMAREIELHAEIVGNLDPRTLEVLTRHLREVGLGEKDAHGVMRGEVTAPRSGGRYVERPDTDLPAHPDA